jgi:hypothetical protein
MALGCAKRQETVRLRTSDEKFNKADDECMYEALKSIASAPPHTAGEYMAKIIYKQCMKVKGYEV